MMSVGAPASFANASMRPTMMRRVALRASSRIERSCDSMALRMSAETIAKSIGSSNKSALSIPRKSSGRNPSRSFTASARFRRRFLMSFSSSVGSNLTGEIESGAGVKLASDSNASCAARRHRPEREARV